MASDERKRFQVDILGPNPEDVSVGELAEFLRALEQAISFAVESSASNPIKLSLVGIEPGSDRLTISAPAEAVPNLAVITATLRGDGVRDLPRNSHQALSDMSKVTRRNNWGFRFVPDKRLNIEAAEVPRGEEIAPPVPNEVRGVTSILARCMRVGGAVTPRVELRLPNKSTLLHVDITEELAKQLGSRIYDNVVLTGEATWDAGTWEVIAFKVTAIAPFESVPVDVSFQKLAESAGGAWEGVDPAEFVHAQRGEHSD